MIIKNIRQVSWWQIFFFNLQQNDFQTVQYEDIDVLGLP